MRQNTKGPNKLEQAFGAWLRAKYQAVHEQSVTLLLANGVRYTPDFVVYQGGVMAFETKGFMRDDAAVKIKVAASVYPWIKFWLVKKNGRTAWSMQEILP